MKKHEPLIDVPTLNAGMDNPHLRIVDCRFDLLQPEQGRADYVLGHIPGAVFADLDRDLAAPVTAATGRHPLPDAQRFAEKLGRWGIANGDRVVVYDSGSGAFAARLWWMLRWLGHSAVRLLDGGFAAWTSAGYPIESRAAAPVPAVFNAEADSAMVVTTESLVTDSRSARPPLLVDARDPARFAGRAEPIDAVAGHVPGAINFPLTNSLDADGRWLAAEELRRRWAEALPAPPDDEWTVMCGSGVTACHLALSAELAGLRAPRLYAGSWSEWIVDPARPVATGDGA